MQLFNILDKGPIWKYMTQYLEPKDICNLRSLNKKYLKIICKYYFINNALNPHKSSWIAAQIIWRRPYIILGAANNCVECGVVSTPHQCDVTILKNKLIKGHMVVIYCKLCQSTHLTPRNTVLTCHSCNFKCIYSRNFLDCPSCRTVSCNACFEQFLDGYEDVDGCGFCHENLRLIN